jgi:hypothetical protein
VPGAVGGIVIQVEERPEVDQPPPSPTTNGLVIRIASMAGLTLAIGLVPWERWSAPAGNGWPALTFQARIWSGSGSLFGLLAVILSALLVLLCLARRWWARLDVTGTCLALATGVVVCLGVKVGAVLLESALYHSDQSDLGQPIYLGLQMGIVLTIAWAVPLLMVFAGRRASGRSWTVAGVTVITLVLIGALYVWSGLAWWGGPVADPRYLGGGNGIGTRTFPGHTGVLEGLISIEDVGHVRAVLDGVDSIEFARGFQPGSPYLITYSDDCISDDITPSALRRCAVPVAGALVPPRTPKTWFSLAVPYRVTSPGVYRIVWTRIRYHVGPFHFEIFRTDQFTVCAPEPAQESCPGD